jgi:glycosyltransferase involved in cell wall biosynthesis
MTPLSVTVVMPAYNAGLHLPRVIPATLAALKGGRLIVVDSGSSDATARIAGELGAEVLRLGHNGGPALARNRGVELVTTPICLFIDSDCVTHEDVVEVVRSAFEATPDLVSLTGSYDDSPPERNFFSQYMNLRHHYTHQQANPESPSFWAGCGAVSTDVFRRVGGFDAEQFPTPAIEDVELGYRLRSHGRMRLDPALQVTHLKRWSFWGVVKTDIFSRAAPWSRLILSTRELPNALNLAWTQRLASAIAPLTLLAPLAIPAAAFGWFGTAAVMIASAATSGWIHRRMFALFWRRRGPAFAVGAILFHQVHLIYSGATLAVLAAQSVIKRRSGRVAAAKSG